MPFPCPSCRASVDRHPDAWRLRCPSCGARLRSRAAEAGAALAFDVQVAGRPETRRRVLVPWDEAQAQRLRAWLLWSSVVTVGLVGVLFLLASMLR